ncbi:xylosylprotein 4-beta-galactosyltransferase [Paragonimus westermani]|uniref:Xylosylprotein 4-beta-galactosyltransferase n=1 Tax=Paragonimus westermani TaxID=34504 RepID=A0A5J4NR10_9TREM|nr:xylosylprotein 4-beta-galactosyltransferase [Paragonimus westermani]
MLSSLRVDLRRVSRLFGLFVLVLFGLYLFLPAHDTQPDPDISTNLQLPFDVELCNRHVTTRQPYVSHRRHPHRLALLIPFRERFTELQQFLVHLERFLNNQNVIHTYYVLNQVDNLRFNRAALLNVGVVESNKAETEGILLDYFSSHGKGLSWNVQRICLPRTDYLALHDVDLLPLDPGISYTWPSDAGIRHLIPAQLHPRYYWFKNYFGGAVLITRARFLQINGLSNSFWGWGSEDDEFRLRILRSGLNVRLFVTRLYCRIHTAVFMRRRLTI